MPLRALSGQKGCQTLGYPHRFVSDLQLDAYFPVVSAVTFERNRFHFDYDNTAMAQQREHAIVEL